jgi:hypothetical protein
MCSWCGCGLPASSVEGLDHGGSGDTITLQPGTQTVYPAHVQYVENNDAAVYNGQMYATWDHNTLRCPCVLFFHLVPCYLVAHHLSTCMPICHWVSTLKSQGFEVWIGVRLNAVVLHPVGDWTASHTLKNPRTKLALFCFWLTVDTGSTEVLFSRCGCTGRSVIDVVFLTCILVFTHQACCPFHCSCSCFVHMVSVFTYCRFSCCTSSIVVWS